MTFFNGCLHDQNKWTYIDNTNLDYTCLNRGGLYLNRKGIVRISRHSSANMIIISSICLGRLVMLSISILKPLKSGKYGLN